MHHAEIIAIDRDSYRLKEGHEHAALQAQKRKSKGYVTVRWGKARSADLSSISGEPILPASTAQRHPR
jgi:hypothetical protein